MKLSIIIPVYNTSHFLKKCLDSVINQTYKNLEIIVVNDCSTDNSMSIIEEYLKKDKRTKVVTHEKNKGLFQARLSGAKVATGDYIAFLDSDDYVSIDFYRTLITNAEENHSDMVWGNMVLEYDDGKRMVYNLFEANFDRLCGEECIEEYFKQEGLCFAWHTIWNKIYSKEIWDKACKHYFDIKDHLIMTEDFAFSTVLYYYAKRITKVDSDAIFYCKHEKTSTDVKNISLKKFKKNIGDLIISFGFVENFMKQVGIYERYRKSFDRWKALYKSQQVSYLKLSKLKKDEKKEILPLIEQFCNDVEKIKDGEYFASIETKWNDGLEKIKKKIADKNIEYVSFDIFDTLIMRPFFLPSDMFSLMDNYFRDISKNDTGINFSKIRITCEQLAREKLNSDKEKKQDITIDEIYNIIKENYKINEEVLVEMKKKEIELELRFCYPRKTGYELYKMALDLGKKVICISDMYLDINTINRILKNNGYDKIQKVFLSSEIKLTKATGDLFDFAISDLKLVPSKIIHIGDNFDSDIKQATKKNITVGHLKKATDVFLENRLEDVFIKDLPDWQDNKASMNFLGIRTMIAMVANMYFDNPYRPFNKESVFNGDPYLIGYYALGMHIFGVANWLAKDVIKKKYENVVFMARDGYLPMKAYQLLKQIYKDAPQESYLYVSRKALIPASILNSMDLYKLSEVINISKYTPRKVLKYIDGCIDKNKNVEVTLKNNNIDLDKEFENIAKFNEFISIIEKNLFDQDKNNKNLEKIKAYFNEFFKGNSCVFDIGYSARPEMYISKLLAKSIDTYFININHEEAIEHSKIGNFELNTFFQYKPTFTGNVRELILSNTAPSCIGYDTSGNIASPIFEKSNYEYKELTIVNLIQKAALDFIDDLINVFNEDLQRLDYQDYYISMPHEMYLQSPTNIDKQVLGCIYFEDDLRQDGHVNVVEFWNDEICNHNQHSIHNLTCFDGNRLKTHDEKIEEAKLLLLKNRSRPIKLIYYIFFDRITLRRRFREIFYGHKIILKSARSTYNGAKKIKHIIKNR